MFRTRMWCLAVVAAGVMGSPALADTFTNGSFETGNLNGWTQGGGYWYGGWPINPSTYLPGGSNYDSSGIANSVVGQGKDPISGLNTVYAGSYSARINDPVQNYSVSVISQTVKNYTDPNIYFAWAANLEGSHGLTDSDNFTIQLTDDTTGKDLYNVSYSSASQRARRSSRHRETGTTRSGKWRTWTCQRIKGTRLR